MKKYLFIALVSIIAFSSCRHKKEVVQITTIPASNKESTADSTKQPENYRFIISFYSIGAGRDVQAYRKFLDYLSNYQKQTNKTIASEAAPWGREGEVDYCMKLTELTPDQQADFIANLKIALSDAKWVHYSENMPCRNKRN